ncbi:MAG: glycoside hydrolase family 2 [Planctomycetes bacterium]|nr:glycoside hydrolase family 2 [Planctomycetota bacterium]
MRTTWRLVIAVLAVAGFSAAAEWQPAKGPLATRWASTVSPGNVHPEYPRPQMARAAWMNLNGLWQLAHAKEGEAAPCGKDLEKRILVPFPIESALSGVMEMAQRVWYRRTFEIPADWAGKRVLVHFGAVDWEAKVLVNGKEIGSHRGGYDPFSFDISEALKPSGSQEIIVGVFDPTDRGDQPRGKQVLKPGGIFYTPATGIWRTVWLEPVPATRIAGLRLTPDIDAPCLRLIAEAAGTSAGETVVAVASRNGREVGRGSGKPGDEIRIPVPDPALWTPDRPNLYDLAVQLRRGEDVLDRVESYFGMRKISLGEVDGVTRMLLNGKFVFQIGPLDQGFWPDGIYTAPNDEALRYDIEMTKELGFNMARKHVKVEPERWYYWCDKLGLLVWQDMPSGNNRTPESRAQFERELRSMIESYRNHPSIIMWVVFNEGWGQHDTERLTAMVRKLDPSRLASNASGWTDKKVGDIIDVHAYPGPGWAPPEPTRASVNGEFGGLGLAIPEHTWSEKSWGYQGMSDREALTNRYVGLLRRVWQGVEKPGISAAVYTQTTDVETECNGLMTYDRAIVKMVAEKVAAANHGEFPILRTLVPTARDEAVAWRYTFEEPAAGWIRPDFDDSGWKEGPAGFGTKGTPGSVVRTEWKSGAIWIRRTFTLGERIPRDLTLVVHHDEDVEIYINGVLAAKAGGYTTDYDELPLGAEGREALRPGKNVFAVACKQTGGGQYIDVGLGELVERARR